jgi:amino-acid N-acetyltransferase
MQVGATGLFVLTTQTQDWFEERGFQGGDVNDLPETKQSLYNWQRGSKVLFKSLG